MKHWEIIADELSKAGWSWGCVSAVDSEGRTIFMVSPLRNGEYKHATVKIRPDIVPIELHQTTVSQVVGFFDCGRHVDSEVKYRERTRSERQTVEHRLGQTRETGIYVQQKCADSPVNVARTDPDMRE
jgi:hypothetical protein